VLFYLPFDSHTEWILCVTRAAACHFSSRLSATAAAPAADAPESEKERMRPRERIRFLQRTRARVVELIV